MGMRHLSYDEDEYRERSTACYACRREFGVYNFPADAVELAADIHALEQAIELLYAVDPYNIAPSWTEADRDAAFMIKRMTLRRIGDWLRYANHKLATDYLAPEDRHIKRLPRKIYDLTFKPIVERIQQLGEQERSR